jgi:hypothetical protein
MGTSPERREGAGLKAALCTGKPKAALFPTSSDPRIISSKTVAQLWRGIAVSVRSDSDSLNARSAAQPAK